ADARLRLQGRERFTHRHATGDVRERPCAFGRPHRLPHDRSSPGPQAPLRPADGERVRWVTKASALTRSFPRQRESNLLRKKTGSPLKRAFTLVFAGYARGRTVALLQSPELRAKHRLDMREPCLEPLGVLRPSASLREPDRIVKRLLGVAVER